MESLQFFYLLIFKPSTIYICTTNNYIIVLGSVFQHINFFFIPFPEHTLQTPSDSIARCVLFRFVCPGRVHIPWGSKCTSEVAQLFSEDGGSSASFRTDAKAGGGNGSSEYIFIRILYCYRININTFNVYM